MCNIIAIVAPLLHHIIITVSVSNYSHCKSMILLLPNQCLMLAGELAEGEHLTFATVLSLEQTLGSEDAPHLSCGYTSKFIL